MKKPVDDSIGFFFLGQLAKEISEYLLGYSVGCRSPESPAQLGMGLNPLYPATAQFRCLRRFSIVPQKA